MNTQLISWLHEQYAVIVAVLDIDLNKRTPLRSMYFFSWKAKKHIRISLLRLLSVV